MKKFVLCALALSACAPTVTAEPAAQPSSNLVEGVDLSRTPDQPPLEETYPDAAGMPRDVQAYIVRWSDCMHWAGEPAFDEDRRRQIDRGIEKSCTGVDALGARLRARHAAHPAVLDRIKDYETLED